MPLVFRCEWCVPIFCWLPLLLLPLVVAFAHTRTGMLCARSAVDSNDGDDDQLFIVCECATTHVEHTHNSSPFTSYFRIYLLKLCHETEHTRGIRH